MAIPLDQFVHRLADSGLLTEADVQTLIAALPEGKKPTDGEQLARRLVKQKKLTAYQAQEIYKGQGKNLVLGNYVILDKLGQGGMGLVLKAEHKRMKRIVAVKVLSAAALKSPEAVARFHREVEAAARLEHPNIVAAHDADEAHGTHFLAMQYVEGSDLSSLVKREGPLPVAKALHCIVQAARGLEYAHQEGVIHRDIKPANLLLDNKGTVKILDMGLARFEASIAGDGAPELTGTGQIMGTVDFMAPEQAVNTKHADQRADIYSLGISLWYLLTGKVAYDGETLMERIMGHQNKPIPSLRAACPGVPAELEAVFVKMVAKTPETRYQSMTEVLAALSQCVPGEGGSAPSVTVLPGEDSRLSSFLRANPAAGTGSGGAPSPAAVQAIDQAALTLAPEATLNVKAQAEDTDPKSSISLPASVGNARRNNPAASVASPAVAVSPVRAGKATAKSQLPFLVAGSAVAAALLVVGVGLGIWLLTRGAQEEPKDNVAKIDVPKGGSATLGTAEEEVGISQPPTVSGKFALEFDGLDDFVELPTLRFEGRHPVTIEALVTPAHSGATEAAVQICGTAWLSLISRNDGWGAAFIGSSRSAMRFGGGVLSPGRTDHLAVVADSEALRLFVNGQSTGTIFHRNLKFSRGAVSALGAGYDESRIAARDRFFKGRIHGVRISKATRYTRPFTPPDEFEKDATTWALYRFDEGQGTELKDSSGNVHHGKIIGAKWVLSNGGTIPASAPPAAGNYALHFDGAASSLDTSAVTIKTKGPWTIEGWVTPRAPLPKGTEGVLLLGVYPMWTSVKGSGTGGVYWGMGGPTSRPMPTQYSSGKVVLNESAHVALTRESGGDVSFYLNGSRVGEPMPFVFLAQDAPLQVGHPPKNRDGDFYGEIDEVRVSSVVRYTGNFTPKPRFDADADTLALYHFDEGQGDTVADSSRHGRNAKMAGAVWVRSDGKPAPEAVPAPAPAGNYALRFAGKGEVLANPDLAIPGRGSWTVECWITPHDPLPTNGANCLLFHTSAPFFCLKNEGAKGTRWAIGGPVLRPPALVTANDKAVANERTHVAFSRATGRGVTLFIRGVPQNEPMPIYFNGSDLKLRICGPPPQKHDLRFHGDLDEIHVSSVARYQESFTPKPRFEPDDDTLALYHFDEGQGDVINDSSKHGRHLKFVGAEWVRVDSAPVAKAPAGNYALRFAGKGEVLRSDETVVPGRGSWTIEGWISARSPLPSNNANCLVFWTDPPWLSVKHEGGKGVRWAIGGPVFKPPVTLVSSTNVVPNERVHVAYSRGPGGLSFYVNGESQGPPLAIAFSGKDNRLNICNIPTANRDVPFHGDIDEIRVSSVARYKENFTPKPRFEPDDETLALYHFDEGQGDVINDSSKHGRHRKFTGGEWIRVDKPAGR